MEKTRNNKLIMSTMALAGIVGAVGITNTHAFAADEAAMTKVDDKKDTNDSKEMKTEQVKSDTKVEKDMTPTDIKVEKDMTPTDIKTLESDDAVGKNKERALKEINNLTHLPQAEKDGFIKQVTDSKDSNTVLNILNEANKVNAQNVAKQDVKPATPQPVKQEVKPTETPKQDGKQAETPKPATPQPVKQEVKQPPKVITPSAPISKTDVKPAVNTETPKITTLQNNQGTQLTTTQVNNTTDDKKVEDKKVTFKSKEEVLAQLKKMTALPKADMEKYEKEIKDAKTTDDAVAILEKANVGYTGAGSLEELKKEQMSKEKTGQLPQTGAVETTSVASITTASILLGLVLKARKQSE